MTSAAPDPARQRLLHAIMEVGAGQVLAGQALDRVLSDPAARASSGAITDILYGTLRHLPLLDAALAERLRDPDRLPDAVRWALRAGAYERLLRGTPVHAAVHAWVEVVKAQRGPERRLSSLVNAVLRSVDLKDVRDEAASLALSEELWQELQGALGAERAAAAARAMLRPGPLWLTVLREGWEAALEADGVPWRPGPLTGSVAVRPGRSLGELKAFRGGWVQPQNPSSAAVVGLLGEVEGRRVLDVGAGHGVKTAQLAAAGAEVFALEVDHERSRTGERNLRRLGLSATHLVVDAGRPLEDDRVPEVDLALLDAPCTGTGTLRGHPEIKLRWSPRHAHEAGRLQAAMIRSVARKVRPGGLLVYAVCALGLTEGPDVAETFLVDHPDWRAEAFDTALPLSAAPVGGWILPDDQGLDGFYLAKLRRLV